MPPSLPVELVEAILAELANDEETKFDLARCCLVSKSFLALSQPLLHRTASLEVVRPPFPSTAHISARTAQLVWSLALHSHLNAVPRLIDVVGGGLPDNFDAGFASLNLPFLWQRCSRATTLVVDAGLEYLVVNALRRLYPRPVIKHLELHSMHSHAWKIVEELRTFVETLVLASNRGVALEEPVPATLSNLRLTSLHLIYPFTNSSVLLDNALASTCTTLTTLNIAVQALPILPSFSAFTSLKNLRLTIPSGSDEAQFLDDIPSAVSPCTTLEVLTLRFARPLTASDISTLTSSSPDALPASLPSSLLRLDLFSPLFYPSDLINLLRASPQAIHLCTIGRQAYEVPLGERDRRKKKPRLPNEEDEEELRVVAGGGG